MGDREREREKRGGNVGDGARKSRKGWIRGRKQRGETVRWSEGVGINMSEIENQYMWVGINVKVSGNQNESTKQRWRKPENTIFLNIVHFKVHNLTTLLQWTYNPQARCGQRKKWKKKQFSYDIWEPIPNYSLKKYIKNSSTTWRQMRVLCFSSWRHWAAPCTNYVNTVVISMLALRCSGVSQYHKTLYI